MFEKFKEYKNEAEQQTKHKIEILRSNQADDGQELRQYLKNNGIIYRLLHSILWNTMVFRKGGIEPY